MTVEADPRGHRWAMGECLNCDASRAGNRAALPCCTCDHDDDEGRTTLDTACPTHGADAGLAGAKRRAIEALEEWAREVNNAQAGPTAITIHVREDLL